MSDDRTRIVTRLSTVEVGTELNQTYRIDELIAAGGMGEVFKGHNIQTGDPVAIKVVLPEFARDEMIFDLFRKEARVLNHLSHDAIVRYYVFSLDRALGRPYLAMEFVDGPSLADRMKATKLSPADFFGLTRRLADGLHKAHEAGVIHRDISPDNVILPGGLVENAKIIDFGIARSAEVGGATLLGGSFAGKYSYVSPEQLGLFGGDVTPKSDIYSLGLTMAAAVRGHALDMSGSQVDVIEKRRGVPDLNAAGIPKPVHALLTRMLQPDPTNRPATMAEVRDLVDRELASGGDKPKAAKPAPKPTAKVPNTPAGQAQSNAMRNVALGVGFLAVIVVGGLGGWIYVQSQKQATVVQDASTATTPAAETPAPAPDPSASTANEAASSPAADTPSAKPEPDKAVATAEIPKAADPAPVPQPTPAPVVAAAPSPPVSPPVTPPAPAAAATQVPAIPAHKMDVAAIQRFAAGYQANKCIKIDQVSASENSAKFTAIGTDTERSNFERAFTQQAGFTPQITFSPVTSDQCGFLAGLNQLPASSKSLQISLDRTEVKGSQTDQAVMGDPLNVSVSGVNGRNVYFYVVDYAGGIQNINRACPNCIKTGADVTKASLSLSAPDSSDQMIGDFAPVMIFAVASSKPLNAINAQDAFDPADFVKALVPDAASSSDFASGLAYVKLKK